MDIKTFDLQHSIKLPFNKDYGILTDLPFDEQVMVIKLADNDVIQIFKDGIILRSVSDLGKTWIEFHSNKEFEMGVEDDKPLVKVIR